MTALKHIEANRRNALKSTGPTTPEGKRRFALQCRTHQFSSGWRAKVVSNSSNPTLEPQASASLRDQLTAELKDLPRKLQIGRSGSLPPKTL
jgi:hypothetical protein